MNSRENPGCRDFEDKAILYVIDELSKEERAAVEAHAGQCSACAATLEAERQLHNSFARIEQPADSLDRSGFLLARCRSELAEAIDDEKLASEYVSRDAGARASTWRVIWCRRLLPSYWANLVQHALEFHPGWSTAALLLAGALGSVAGGAWYRAALLQPTGNAVMTVSAAPPLSDQELETMGVERIHLEQQDGAEPPRVEVQLRSERPVVVAGTSDDSELRRVLTYVIQHQQQFDAGVRLDSIDALRMRAADPQVRAALCEAARRDSNPAMRLKAIEALRESADDSSVRQVLLDALAGDQNSGVRIEALNALLASFDEESPANAPDPQALAILRERMQKDPNSYVRLRSASALGHLVSAGDAPLSGQPEPSGNAGESWGR